MQLPGCCQLLEGGLKQPLEALPALLRQLLHRKTTVVSHPNTSSSLGCAS